MEDKDEKIIEEHSDEAESDEEETDEIETVGALKQKKKDNKFIASENTAQIQIFLQNANFGNKSDIKQVFDLVNLSTGNDKKYNLRKMEDCAEFFSTCKNREYIILAITLSVFEMIPIGDYANLKDILAECLPVVFQTDQEGKEIQVQQTNAYTSLNTALSVIGGKIFITEEGQQRIGYGEGYKEVLSNIWIQFPDLRKPMIYWLLKVNDIFEYKTSFEVQRVVDAFIRIITEDFQYAKKQVFDRLYLDSDNFWLLARLAQELLEDERFKTDTLNIVLRWLNSESSWLWKPALLVCLYTYDSDIDTRLHKAAVRAIKKRLLGFQNSALRFIVLFAGNSENLRTIMASVFYELYKPGSEEENLAQIYLKMIRYGYYRVNRNKINLPFIVCDTKEQMEHMRFVLTSIMRRYDLYRQLCWILQAYLEEISGYDVSQQTLNHITAFFYVLTRDEYDYQRDILLFLSELKGRVAKIICDKLIAIYRNNGGKRE